MSICWSAVEWTELQVDDVAREIVGGCNDRVLSLVESLIVGHVPLGYLKTTLKHKDQFKKLYHQCMLLSSYAQLTCNWIATHIKQLLPQCVFADKKSGTLESIPDDAEDILVQREKDLDLFLQQQKQVETLVKMFAKVTESITGK